MPILFEAIEAAVQERMQREGTVLPDPRVRGWMQALADSYRQDADMGRLLHATFGQASMARELGSPDAGMAAEKILLWTKEACEAALKP